jgi:hypothetical protein
MNPKVYCYEVPQALSGRLCDKGRLEKGEVFGSKE